MQFAKAVKSKSKLRLGLMGPSGAGKTMSALRIASGLGGRIGLIDTERGSASLYADRWQFDVLELGDRSIPGYVQAMRVAAQAGIEVLIVDSLSHAWESLLEEVERIAKAKYKGNTWSAWNEGTPMQRDLVNALLDFPGHIIATMRSATEWANETNDRGKNTPVRIGLKPIQGKGLEYEFSLLMEINQEHAGLVIKDRSGKFQDKHIMKPDEDFGRALLAWLNDGADKVLAKGPTEEARQTRIEHDQASQVAAGDPRWTAAMASLPRLVNLCGTREQLNKWLVIVRDIARHPESMPLASAVPEKREAIAIAIMALELLLSDGCLDPAENEGIGEATLRADVAKVLNAATPATNG